MSYTDAQMVGCGAYDDHCCYLLPLHLSPRTCSMTTGAPVNRDTLEVTVRWRLMSVCPILVRMEEHVATGLMGTVVSAQEILRYYMTVATL